ncbi:Mce protein [Saccharopolyspora dendranthemae]|uniref:Mce-associated membrane protein n=1 Tax=Saccharopolyspora dendranthemae TaxID=1181886 RepID=A0A561V8W9_9PSEU|nr:Mce protein [Saccharopolyspora dendranthemae]TWG08066.1 Mce-associated membrane protein [Saccharopolyspora dendranthemae]
MARSAAEVRRTAGLVMATALLVGLVVAGTQFQNSARAAAEREESGRQAVAVARQAALALTNISAPTVEQDSQRLASLATGAFSDQFAQQSPAFRDLVTGSQVTSRGEVVEAALSHADDRTAVALAAVRATVGNAGSPEGQERQYRMRITLEKTAGTWLVANLEFVP